MTMIAQSRIPAIMHWALLFGYGWDRGRQVCTYNNKHEDLILENYRFYDIKCPSNIVKFENLTLKIQ